MTPGLWRGRWHSLPLCWTQAGGRDTPFASVCHRKSLGFIQAVAPLAPLETADAAAAAGHGTAPGRPRPLGGASAVGAEAVQD